MRPMCLSIAGVRSVYFMPSEPRSIFSKPRASAQSAKPPLIAWRARYSALEPVEQLLLTLMIGMPRITLISPALSPVRMPMPDTRIKAQTRPSAVDSNSEPMVTMIVSATPACSEPCSNKNRNGIRSPRSITPVTASRFAIQPGRPVTGPGAGSMNPAFAGLVIDERFNPYRACIQGLANEPITVASYVIPAGDPAQSAQGNCVVVDGPYEAPLIGDGSGVTPNPPTTRLPCASA